MSFKNNKGFMWGGITGALVALVFNNYFHDVFHETISTIIILFLLVIPPYAGSYLYIKGKNKRKKDSSN